MTKISMQGAEKI